MQLVNTSSCLSNRRNFREYETLGVEELEINVWSKLVNLVRIGIMMLPFSMHLIMDRGQELFWGIRLVE